MAVPALGPRFKDSSAGRAQIKVLTYRGFDQSIELRVVEYGPPQAIFRRRQLDLRVGCIDPIAGHRRRSGGL